MPVAGDGRNPGFCIENAGGLAFFVGFCCWFFGGEGYGSRTWDDLGLALVIFCWATARDGK